ncbi:50S ribosomal protein L11 methyltransferase [Dehalococcoidia bacterium]|nr:50S ribosomal protein L11 methyltransferase [Dehalococcoidia bacterium]
MEWKSINEYAKAYGLEGDLPDIFVSLAEGVYPPKLDSFLIAKELIRIVQEGHNVLDIGTGTGILAIVAATKGAAVVATDVHEASVKCARHNASLNSVELDGRVGNLFEPIRQGELFDIVVGNMTSLPTPRDEQHDEYTARTVDAGYDGRRYLDPLIDQAPKYLKEGGYFLTQHSNFANIEKTRNKLDELGFEVELRMYEYPAGKTSRQRIEYFLRHLPENCHPIKKEDGWYQKIAVFIARSSGGFSP